MSAEFAALISFIGVVVGAALVHIFTEKRSRRDDLAQLRLRAYSDFIHATSRLMAARRLGETEIELEQLTALNDAKARICVCAEIPVVEALSEFWLTGGTAEREEEVLAFKRLCERMRESFGNKNIGAGLLTLSDTLFRLEPSSYSYRAEKTRTAHVGQPSSYSNPPTSNN